MLDRYDREIDYLRISVTDKCNLRCTYCLPEEGVPLGRHGDFLRLEEMARVVQAGVGLGLTKVRLTGGEPLVKRGIVELVRLLCAVPGLGHLAMTTNGTLLEPLARPLRQAGLDSLNISLDSLDAGRYREITRRGELADALAGIEAAREAGFPIKINMVVLEDTREEEVRGLAAFCRERGLTLQLINHYVLSREKRDAYAFDRPPRCALCNRIRLLADGTLKPCLHSDLEIPLDRQRIETSLRAAVRAKPRRGGACTRRRMIEIGG
jgi:cyclic pyranopterin phosphate synthase